MHATHATGLLLIYLFIYLVGQEIVEFRGQWPRSPNNKNFSFLNAPNTSDPLSLSSFLMLEDDKPWDF